MPNKSNPLLGSPLHRRHREKRAVHPDGALNMAERHQTVTPTHSENFSSSRPLHVVTPSVALRTPFNLRSEVLGGGSDRSGATRNRTEPPPPLSRFSTTHNAMSELDERRGVIAEWVTNLASECRDLFPMTEVSGDATFASQGSPYDVSLKNRFTHKLPPVNLGRPQMPEVVGESLDIADSTPNINGVQHFINRISATFPTTEPPGDGIEPPTQQRMTNRQVRVAATLASISQISHLLDHYNQHRRPCTNLDGPLLRSLVNGLEAELYYPTTPARQPPAGSLESAEEMVETLASGTRMAPLMMASRIHRPLTSNLLQELQYLFEEQERKLNLLSAASKVKMAFMDRSITRWQDMLKGVCFKAWRGFLVNSRRQTTAASAFVNKLTKRDTIQTHFYAWRTVTKTLKYTREMAHLEILTQQVGNENDEIHQRQQEAEDSADELHGKLATLRQQNSALRQQAAFAEDQLSQAIAYGDNWKAIAVEGADYWSSVAASMTATSTIVSRRLLPRAPNLTMGGEKEENGTLEPWNSYFPLLHGNTDLEGSVNNNSADSLDVVVSTHSLKDVIDSFAAKLPWLSVASSGAEGAPQYGNMSISSTATNPTAPTITVTNDTSLWNAVDFIRPSLALGSLRVPYPDVAQLASQVLLSWASKQCAVGLHEHHASFKHHGSAPLSSSNNGPVHIGIKAVRCGNFGSDLQSGVTYVVLLHTLTGGSGISLQLAASEIHQHQQPEQSATATATSSHEASRISQSMNMSRTRRQSITEIPPPLPSSTALTPAFRMKHVLMALDTLRIALPFSVDELASGCTDVGFLVMFTLWWHFSKPPSPFEVRFKSAVELLSHDTTAPATATLVGEDIIEMQRVAMMIAAGSSAGGGGGSAAKPPDAVIVRGSIEGHFTGVTLEDTHKVQQYTRHCRELHQQWIQCRSVLQHYALYVSCMRASIIRSSVKVPSSVVAVATEGEVSERLFQLAECALSITLDPNTQTQVQRNGLNSELNLESTRWCSILRPHLPTMATRLNRSRSGANFQRVVSPYSFAALKEVIEGISVADAVSIMLLQSIGIIPRLAHPTGKIASCDLNPNQSPLFTLPSTNHGISGFEEVAALSIDSTIHQHPPSARGTKVPTTTNVPLSLGEFLGSGSSPSFAPPNSRSPRYDSSAVFVPSPSAYPAEMLQDWNVIDQETNNPRYLFMDVSEFVRRLHEGSFDQETHLFEDGACAKYCSYALSDTLRSSSLKPPHAPPKGSRSLPTDTAAVMLLRALLEIKAVDVLCVATHLTQIRSCFAEHAVSESQRMENGQLPSGARKWVHAMTTTPAANREPTVTVSQHNHTRRRSSVRLPPQAANPSSSSRALFAFENSRIPFAKIELLCDSMKLQDNGLVDLLLWACTSTYGPHLRKLFNISPHDIVHSRPKPSQSPSDQPQSSNVSPTPTQPNSEAGSAQCRLPDADGSLLLETRLLFAISPLGGFRSTAPRATLGHLPLPPWISADSPQARRVVLWECLENLADYLLPHQSNAVEGEGEGVAATSMEDRVAAENLKGYGQGFTPSATTRASSRHALPSKLVNERTAATSSSLSPLGSLCSRIPCPLTKHDVAEAFRTAAKLHPNSPLFASIDAQIDSTTRSFIASDLSFGLGSGEVLSFGSALDSMGLSIRQFTLFLLIIACKRYGWWYMLRAKRHELVATQFAAREDDDDDEGGIAGTMSAMPMSDFVSRLLTDDIPRQADSLSSSSSLPQWTRKLHKESRRKLVELLMLPRGGGSHNTNASLSLSTTLARRLIYPQGSIGDLLAGSLEQAALFQQPTTTRSDSQWQMALVPRNLRSRHTSLTFLEEVLQRPIVDLPRWSRIFGDTTDPCNTLQFACFAAEVVRVTLLTQNVTSPLPFGTIALPQVVVLGQGGGGAGKRLRQPHPKASSPRSRSQSPLGGSVFTPKAGAAGGGGSNSGSILAKRGPFGGADSSFTVAPSSLPQVSLEGSYLHRIQLLLLRSTAATTPENGQPTLAKTLGITSAASLLDEISSSLSLAANSPAQVSLRHALSNVFFRSSVTFTTEFGELAQSLLVTLKHNNPQPLEDALRVLAPTICNDAASLLTLRLRGDGGADTRLEFGQYLLALHLLGIGIAPPPPASLGDEPPVNDPCKYGLLISPAFALEVFCSFGNTALLQRTHAFGVDAALETTPLQKAISKNTAASFQVNANAIDSNASLVTSPTVILQQLRDLRFRGNREATDDEGKVDSSPGDPLLDVARGVGDTCYVSAPIYPAVTSNGSSPQQQCPGCEKLSQGLALDFNVNRLTRKVVEEMEELLSQQANDNIPSGNKRVGGGGKRGGVRNEPKGTPVSQQAKLSNRRSSSSHSGAVPTYEVLDQARTWFRDINADAESAHIAFPWWLRTSWWCRVVFPAPPAVTGPVRNTSSQTSTCAICTPSCLSRGGINSPNVPSLTLSEFEAAIGVILHACIGDATLQPGSIQRCVLACGTSSCFTSEAHREAIAVRLSDPLTPSTDRIYPLVQFLVGHYFDQF